LCAFAARLGLAEMIRGGTTTYCDMYYFEDAIADETAEGWCARRAW
jgi:cytosine/adenosine deaminase-related metal-dependent hydrolase